MGNNGVPTRKDVRVFFNDLKTREEFENKSTIKQTSFHHRTIQMENEQFSADEENFQCTPL